MKAKRLALSFYGGTREVTGACYLLEVGSPSTRFARSGSTKTLRVLVDCGMFQGTEDCDFRNHKPFPFDAAKIDALVITHAHIDHVGRIPKLYRDGFRGPIYATAPTRDLAEILLEDAMNFFRSGERELYRASDIAGVMGLFQPVAYGENIPLGDDVALMLVRASHILGSAIARFTVGGRTIVFSGDLGSDPSVLIPPRATIPEGNILVVESTYGNREHLHLADRRLMLERAMEDVAARGGAMLVPVFATERTQEILYEMNELLQFRRVPPMAVFVDSPLAIHATKIFSRYPEYYREEVRELYRKHAHLFEFRNLRFTPSVEESKAIAEERLPKVILAGSGMSTGGRILHHEERYLPDPKSILLVTGYQAAGSLGRRLLDHAQEVKIYDTVVPVRAEVRVVDGYSAHADQSQLLEFVTEMRDNLERVFVVQGEPDAALGFQQVIQDRLGVPALAPVHGERFEL